MSLSRLTSVPFITNRTAELIDDELSRAQALFPGNFNSLHEGYAVLKEEVEELWDEIKKNQSKRDKQKIRTEAIQFADMAIRIINELT